MSKELELLSVHCHVCRRELGRILSGLIYCLRCRAWTDSRKQQAGAKEAA